MKVCICGGRTFTGWGKDLVVALGEHLKHIGATHVISGCAPGADQLGKQAAIMAGLPIIEMPAAWEKYGMAAGPIRNEEMAKVADMVIAFDGGKGTHDMKLRALKHNKPAYQASWSNVQTTKKKLDFFPIKGDGE